MVDPLAQLRDIHLPPPSNTLPPLYYIIAAALVFLLLIFSFIYRKTAATRLIKRQALKELLQLKKDSPHTPAQEIVQSLSTLLKRVALQYYPREKIAGLQGEAWVDFLSKNSRNLPFNNIKFTLIEFPLTKTTNEVPDLSLLFSLTERWIKQRRKKCLK